MVLSYQILEFVRLHVIQKKVDMLKLSRGHISRRFVTNASYARIKYVAGYCVFKLRKKIPEANNTKLYNKTKQGQNQYKESKCCLKIIARF